MPTPTPQPEQKKAPQFAAVKLRPMPEKPQPCCDDETCENSVAAPVSAEGERYSWQVSGMDCAACARKVENAVRQLEGIGLGCRLLSPQKNSPSWRTVMCVHRSNRQYSRRVISCEANTARRKLPLLACVKTCR